MANSLGSIGFAFYITLIILLVIVSPIISIAAVNTLFEISIEYSFINYFCVLWLSLAFGSTGVSTSD